jgi:hypothetical protein
MPIKITTICTCDDFCDNPCPMHEIGNELQNKLMGLQADVERLRVAIGNLIDAIQDVQCWQGTHVGACIDQACALLPNEPDQGRR